MKEITRVRKNTKLKLSGIGGEAMMMEKLKGIILHGKAAFDDYVRELGVMLAETIMYVEREELSGPDYYPHGLQKKWASQMGSVYIGGEKYKVVRPRLRGPQGEIGLKSYAALKDPRQFSEELLNKVLGGFSSHRYAETIRSTAGCFGISSGSISNHLIEASSRQVSLLLERDLSKIEVAAVFMDTIHRGEKAFIVALGLDVDGKKHNLGFWEGATENHEIATALLSDLESRGLVLSKRTLYITDGGKGVIKSLRERYGKDLIHQRCTIHKDRNIQKHLPKRYRKESHRRYRRALELTSYEEARKELLGFEKWLRAINESAADSLLEALEEILTLHRLKVPALLRKTLHSTNPIEALFSQVRKMESNIKRYRGSKMSRRWLGACLIQGEKRFRKIKGFASIGELVKAIENEQEMNNLKKAA